MVAAGGRVGGYGANPQLKAKLLRAEGVVIVGRRIRHFARVRVQRTGQALSDMSKATRAAMAPSNGQV